MMQSSERSELEDAEPDNESIGPDICMHRCTSTSHCQKRKDLSHIACYLFMPKLVPYSQSHTRPTDVLFGVCGM